MKKIYIIIILFLSTTVFAQVDMEMCDQNDPIITDTNNPSVKNTETFTYQPYSPPPTPPIENRIIFWVHGLGGDAGSWTVAAGEVRNTKGCSFTTSYLFRVFS